jgi:hypothetical protein
MESPLPRFNHGHDISQFKWMYSKLNQKEISDINPNVTPPYFFDMEYSNTGNVISSELIVNAATPPTVEALITHHVVRTFHNRNARYIRLQNTKKFRLDGFTA